ncbi:tRNA (adenosine(37)-N6)-threonylcarbamoyltransferase complex transferase subunit TsaD [Lishizhenia sp.]|uniref:tRNA (adenosine(37)-N6)-threonylcarbamoyltransferase complex transferase subunit TsaD n=1 Tax=Lishizhenia sp. TaxID=2497594 RepID=UPI00299F1D24|nr:tRNA (adenosine(37)-N6)-threonylcarbamoyltransferase complex transferase subunit TsaD [Lishizhenia sp.]MDX1446588.1 tRNA (adenosine(37)-N6)-threonylcarbamoyltransferase complex transferase subunit TsaD [Lishizhenia sp.]
MKDKEIIILGIESSCDDTSAAVLRNEEILSNEIASQGVHKEYGGVVPELASRAHQQNIIPVVDTAIKKAGIQKEDIDAIAFTRGPGLLGSLIVGTSFAKSFAMGMDIPMLDCNHMHGHVLAHFIDDEGKDKPEFPFLCLTVSGGHTQIVLVKDYLDMEVIGTTIDDAAGEAFDKSAKILGLPYPGGPLIDKNAKLGDENKFEFAKPNVKDLNYSFSGLKTSILYFIQNQEKENPNFVEENMNDLCASIQKTILDILFKKLIKAAKEQNIKSIAIAGGVSANSGLRTRLEEEAKKRQWKTFIPKFEYCTDNAAMIAITGRYHYLRGEFADQSIAATARLKF